MATLRIIMNYTPRSHILCGEALKDVYADFRVNVLRTAEWATWHSKLQVPGGKGWCIRKADLQELENALRQASIPFEMTECTTPPSRSKGRAKKTPVGSLTAYNLFTKDMWADRAHLVSVLGDNAKNTVMVTKYIAREWKKMSETGPTQWHARAIELRREMSRQKEDPSKVEQAVDRVYESFDKVVKPTIDQAFDKVVKPIIDQAFDKVGSDSVGVYQAKWSELGNENLEAGGVEYNYDVLEAEDILHNSAFDDDAQMIQELTELNASLGSL